MFGEPALAMTTAVTVALPICAVMVLVSALVVRSDVVHAPLASVGPLLAANESPLPLLLSVTVTLGVGFPNTSAANTVSAVAATWSATMALGLATSDECAVVGPPATNVVWALSVAPPATAVTVLVCALSVEKVVVKAPLALV